VKERKRSADDYFLIKGMVDDGLSPYSSVEEAYRDAIRDVILGRVYEAGARLARISSATSFKPRRQASASRYRSSLSFVVPNLSL